MRNLTKGDRKKWSILIWTWLRDNAPAGKEHLPKGFRSFKGHLLEDEAWHCPLCTVLLDEGSGCAECPLHHEREMTKPCHPSFYKWAYAASIEERKKLADIILQMIKRWKV